MRTCDYQKYEHLHTYRRKKFQNNYLGLLLLVYKKLLNIELRMIIDSTYRVLHEFYIPKLYDRVD